MLSVVNTTSGAISGLPGQSAVCYFGIPYATARRFCPPERYPRWDGVRPCTHFAPQCIQRPLDSVEPYQKFYVREYGAMPAAMAEDSLCLNIWTPAETPEDRLPVMVWIHGGGNQRGGGDEPPVDGMALARQGVILVTFNYRLGPFAMFAHPALSAQRADGVSGNNDLRDQQAALSWVQENIAAFGGDPDNVTLFGQSTGAGCVACHLFSPGAAGLFQKVAIQSGLGGVCSRSSTVTLEDTEAWGMQVCRVSGKSLEQLQTMRAPELLELFYDAARHGAGEPPVHGMDGVCLPEAPGRALRSICQPEMPMLLSVVQGDRSADCEVDNCRRRARAGGQTFLAYFHPEIPGHNLPGTLPDGMAYHNSELWFLFETLERCWRPFDRTHAALAKTMCTAWAQFAKTGAPEGWKPWSAEGEWVVDLTNREPYAVSRLLSDFPELHELLED